MEKTEFIHFPWQRSPSAISLAITGAWMKANCPPAKYRLCGNFHQLGILSRMLGWPDTSRMPRSLVGDGSANMPLVEHTQKGDIPESRATSFLKGDLVQVKLNWCDFIQLQVTELVNGSLKHPLGNMV